MNSKYFYPNVKRLCKEQKRKISDVEKTVGVSVGYFSRRKPASVNVLIKTAEALGTTIDGLISEPPTMTNAKKFVEVFGFMPGFEELLPGVRYIPSLNGGFWDEEYKAPEEDDGK